jgi:hypothetical protein
MKFSVVFILAFIMLVWQVLMSSNDIKNQERPGGTAWGYLGTDRNTLFSAAEHGDLNYVQEYLQGGGVVDRYALYGATALFYAVRGAQVDMVSLLLEAGADPTTTDHLTNMTPITLLEAKGENCFNENEKKIYALLLQARERHAEYDSTLKELEQTWNKEKASELFEKPDLPNRVLTPLLFAAGKAKDVKTFCNLIERMNALPGTLYEMLKEGKFAFAEDTLETLLRAVELKHNEQMCFHFKTLYKEKRLCTEASQADPISMYIDGPLMEGNTPLMMSASMGNFCLVEFLLELGANPELRNDAGKSAIDLVCTHWGTPEDAAKIRILLQANKKHQQ